MRGTVNVKFLTNVAFRYLTVLSQNLPAPLFLRNIIVAMVETASP
jgi:hypothetical protein